MSAFLNILELHGALSLQIGMWGLQLFLKRCFATQGHLLASNRVAEGDFLCMKIHAVGLGAIEVVAQNGDAQSLFVGTMDTQLVGAACVWVQFYACDAVLDGKNFVVSDCRFAIFLINHLSWTV